jgi:hypothetical protein
MAIATGGGSRRSATFLPGRSLVTDSTRKHAWLLKNAFRGVSSSKFSL